MTNSTKSSFQVGRKNRGAKLAPLLKKWIECCDRYIDRMRKLGGDVPFHYNEVAQTGLLSAAAWLAGGVTLQDYRAKKFRKSMKPSRGPGRNDLYVYFRDQEFVFESKYSHARLSRSRDNHYDAASAALKSATADARRNCVRATRKIGICFVVPTGVDSDDEKLEEWRSGLLKNVRHDAAAWYFTNKRLRLAKPLKRFPGVVMLMRNAN